MDSNERKRLEVAKDIVEEIMALITLEKLNKNWLPTNRLQYCQMKEERLKEAFKQLEYVLEQR